MIEWPNLLLVAGTGRNVGKTTFVCKVVEHTTKHHPTIAIKITPHIHAICSSCNILFQSENLVITEETNSNSSKDSSKMLAAGAQRVFYVQGADNKMPQVIDYLKDLIPKHAAVVCESAGLRNYVVPGLFVILSHANNESNKNSDKLLWADHHILDFNYTVNEFIFEHGKWVK